MAQLKLAEQVLAEKDHHLQSSEYRADMAMMEKEALEEEIVAIKSLQNTSIVGHESPQHESSTPVRVGLSSKARNRLCGVLGIYIYSVCESALLMDKWLRHIQNNMMQGLVSHKTINRIGIYPCVVQCRPTPLALYCGPALRLLFGMTLFIVR